VRIDTHWNGGDDTMVVAIPHCQIIRGKIGRRIRNAHPD
jgi:hypothetical protein